MTPQKLLHVAKKSPLFHSIGERQLKSILKEFRILQIHKGDILFQAEERSRVMYVVIDGKLRLEKKNEQNHAVGIASLSPGEVVGEVAVLTRSKHSGQVRAITDASLAAISKADLERVLKKFPRVLRNLTQIEALRLRRNIVRDPKKNKELGFVLHLYCVKGRDFNLVENETRKAIESEDLPSFVVMNTASLHAIQGDTVAIRAQVNKALMHHNSAYLSVCLEDLNEKALQALLLMADRLVLTLSEDMLSVRQVSQALTKKKLKERAAAISVGVFLVHRASTQGATVREIEETLGLQVRFRLRLDKDFWSKQEVHGIRMQSTTMARIVCDSSQGIAFGGGGARALTEIGVIAELERNNMEFDHVAGTSMGALIAAFYAQGLTSREMSERFQEFLPSDKGLLHYSLPFISFFSDRSMNNILRRLFGKTRIEDLPRPLTIIAADLISGREIRFKKGLVRRALRASMSLPVVFPPVKYRGYYLVDGGAINNVPGNVLRDQGATRVLGVNCTPLEDNSINQYFEETNLFQILKPGDSLWMKIRRSFKAIVLFLSRPPILQIANRAMNLEGSELIRQKEREFDLLLSPDVSRFGLFDFDRREEIVDVGRYHTRSHTRNLKRLFR